MTAPKEQSAMDIRAFRQTMGLFATGVTVVAVEIDGIVRGMTANAVASLSLEPPLVLVCVQKDANMADFLQQASGFSINMLSEAQEDLSSFFASVWARPDPPAFAFQPWVGGPRLEGAIGAAACQTEEFLEGGDHWIVIGRVLDLYRSPDPAAPLLYYRGRYRRIAPEPRP